VSNSLTEQSLPDEGSAPERAASKVDAAGSAEHGEPRRPAARSAEVAGGLGKPGSKGTTSIDVEIFGAVYHVRGEQDPESLRRLAAVVDRKMREISRHVPVVDSGKIAILAALNLADELLQCNNQQEGERVEMMEKVAELTGLLTEALDT
jgi:cell division protein ZapA